MRLWFIWNLLSSLAYFVGFIVCLVITVPLLVVFLPPVISVLLGVCIAIGIVLGVVGNVSRSRQIKRDAVDKELHDIAAGRSPDSHPNG